MNVTPPTSGTGSAHGASHAQPANSSLADFLLAGSPANSGQDFRSIAAAWFGVESPTDGVTQSPVKGSATEKQTGTALPHDEPRTGKNIDKDKDKLSNLASVTLHPGLTVPLPVTQPLLDPTPKADVNASTLGLPDLKAVVEDSAVLATQTPGNTFDKPGNAVSSHHSALPSIIEPDMKGAAAEGDDGKELPPDPGKGIPLVEPPPTDAVKQRQEPALQVSPAPATMATAKRAATERSNEPPKNEPPKEISAEVSNSRGLVLPADAHLAAGPAVQMPATAVSENSPSAPEQASAASAKQILDSSITAKVAQQSPPANPGLAAGVRKIPVPAAPEPAGIKAREIKARELSALKMNARGIKDPRMSASQSAKLTHAEDAGISDGLAKSVAANGKEIAGVALDSHADAHTRPLAAKQSVVPLSSQVAVAEADGPDEALPTSVPSPVTTAKLVQGLSQSEFRVGMQTPEFGSIDIRTSVARHMFSAQISVEHGDVAKSMTADLPALYHRLADQQVPVTSIVIQGQSLATSSGLAQDAQPQNSRPQSHYIAKSDSDPVLPVMTEALDSAGRLDIRI